jgi:hypothetical protein
LVQSNSQIVKQNSKRVIMQICRTT